MEFCIQRIYTIFFKFIMIFIVILHDIFELIVHDDEHKSWSAVTDSGGMMEKKFRLIKFD